MIKTHVHPQIKRLTLTLRVTQKHAFFVHQNNYSIHLSCVLVKKFHMPKIIVWAMLKKEKEKEKNKISMPKGMREKMHAKEHEEKKRKRTHTFK